ncbi:hypothetical protein DQ02_16370 [Citrobacter amalonaticus]|nr:hypothetical protein DQ02_16370 [Citrobacter amalonaticus]
MRIAQHGPGNYRHQKRADVKPCKGDMLGHRARLHQAFIAHHPDGKTDVGKLYQQQTSPEVIGHLVITNNPCANHRQQRAKRIPPAQPPFTHQIVNQRDIERRQHGKQQQFRDSQIEISVETQHIHDAKLHGSHQHIKPDSFQAVPARTQERQEYQRRQTDPNQHGKVAIDVPGKVFPEQAEGESPQDRGNDQ